MEPVSSEENQLKSTTRKLHRLFGKGKPEAGWTDMDDRMAREVSHKHLIQLTDAEYRHLARHALCMESMKSIEHGVQFFLPRFLDDLGSGQAGNIGLGDTIIAESLRKVRWTKWSKSKTEMVEEWFIAWWHAALAHAIPEFQQGRWPAIANHRLAGRVLKVMALAGLELVKPLSDWCSLQTRDAIRQFLWFHDRHNARLDVLQIDGWDVEYDGLVAIESQNSVARWMLDARTVGWLETNGRLLTDPQEQEALGRVIDRLKDARDEAGPESNDEG